MARGLQKVTGQQEVDQTLHVDRREVNSDGYHDRLLEWDPGYLSALLNNGGHEPIDESASTISFASRAQPHKHFGVAIFAPRIA